MNDRNVVPLQIREISQIDLNSHGVVEASAGTGKTYTIEHLVVELLKSNTVKSLDEILVVTFTEKAVGELKDRIRNLIRKFLENEPSEILYTSFENFDSASIYTIHGFCNKILNDYAFENRKHLTNSLVDDRLVYDQELSRIKRDSWPNEYKNHLRTVLQLSGYPGSTGTGGSSWEELVIDIALRYQLSGFDTINPQEETDILSRMITAEQSILSGLDSLAAMVGFIDDNDYTKSDLYIKYASLNINKNSIKKRLSTCLSLLKILSAHTKKILSLNELADFIISQDYGDTGFNALNSAWNKPGSDYESKLPNLPEIIQALETLRSIDFTHLKLMLSVKTIHQLKKEGLNVKLEKGLISYDDMVLHVYNVLSDPKSPVKTLLRKRYHYALVDEFQDTDMLQWAIFKNIFLESESNRLFIIGDPKQAIYGFRGADINAYFLARDEILSSFHARFYSLSENWRSSPDLISAFNSIFMDTNWFSDNTIRYLPSSYPEKKEHGPENDIGSLFIVNCGSTSGSEARQRFSDFIAREIQTLINGNYDCELNNIAILVTKWKEAETIEKSLKQAAIKYSFYKKEGLYQSRESLELYHILLSIASPHDTAQKKIAFATRFFNIDTLSLLHFDSMPGEHPALLLFEKWVFLSDKKMWQSLFQSILEETGILYRRDNEDYDRQIINYKSIIQALEIEAYRNNYCINEIAAFLNRLRLNTATGTEASNIQKIDLDQPGVQLLTMHASKGLQFKVVFIGGGFTKRDRSEFWTYHRNNQRVFDLVKDDREKDLNDRERQYEEERLFYVAITRAQNRVYIPIFEPASRSTSTSGILAKKMQQALLSVCKDSCTTQVNWDNTQSILATSTRISKKHEQPLMVPNPLFPETGIQFLHRTSIVESFSSIKSKLHGDIDPYDRHNEFSLLHPIGADESVTLAEELPADQTAPSAEVIPHGIESGLMLHEILEKIDYNKIRLITNPSDMLIEHNGFNNLFDTAIINNFRNITGTIDLVKKEAAYIVWNTLHAPLDGTELKLCNIDKKIHEVEFYYPSSQAGVANTIAHIFSEGFLHGYIDMIFEYNGKYYLVDWKSNFIEKGYSNELISKNIVEMHYDLQIQIYIKALIRWLKQSKADYSYNRHFGGIYYLYLRGIDPAKSGDGIFFYRPVEDPEQSAAI